MYLNKKLYAFLSISLLSMSIYTPDVRAAISESALCTESSIVCITETYDQTTSGQQNSDISFYSITNNGADQIYSFAVTNTNAAGTFGRNIAGWDSASLSQAEWDSPSTIFGNYTSGGEILKSWVSGIENKNGAIALGSFSTLFGDSVDENGNQIYVNFYWNNGASHFLTQDVTLEKFYFNGLPESQAVAFTGSGAIAFQTLTTSTVSAVPEPETYLMFLAGLGLLGLMSKRQQT